MKNLPHVRGFKFGDRDDFSANASLPLISYSMRQSAIVPIENGNSAGNHSRLQFASTSATPYVLDTTPGLRLFFTLLGDHLIQEDPQTGVVHYDAIAVNFLLLPIVDFAPAALQRIALSQFVNLGSAAAKASTLAFDAAFAKPQLSLDVIYAGMTSVLDTTNGAGGPPAGTEVEKNFAYSAIGIAASIAVTTATGVAELGLAGLAISWASGYFISALSGAVYDYINFTNGGQVAASYLDSFLSAPSVFANKLEDTLKQLSDQLRNPVNFINNNGLNTIKSDIGNTINDLHTEFVNELKNYQTTSDYLTSLAKYLIGIGYYGDALNIEFNLQPQLASYVNNIGTLYPQYINVLGSLKASVATLNAHVSADFPAINASTADNAIYNDAYNAANTFNSDLLSQMGTLTALIHASNPRGGSSSGYGTITANGTINGTITGTTGADFLNGTSAADIFNGLGGGDVVIGNGGIDIFEFNAGYGALEVSESDPHGTSSALLVLGAGISQSGLAVRATTTGAIILTIGSAGDQITLDNELNGPQFGVAGVSFADGSNLTRAQLAQMALNPTTGADVMFGTTSGQTYDGLGGGDIVIGAGGGDSFLYNRGYGSLEIIEKDASLSPVNSLHFGTGITTTDILVTTNTLGDIVLTVQSGGITGTDRIIIDNEALGNQYGVQSVAFSDGTTWTHNQLMQFAAVPTTGADSLFLTAPQVIDGLGGGDIIHGSGGADSFFFNSNYGALEISETTSLGGASQALLRLGTGLSFNGMTVTGDAAGDLLLNFSATDVVKLDSGLLGLNHGIGKVIDSTGNALTAIQLVSLEVKSGGSGNVIYGTAGPNQFTNLGHGDIVIGNDGSDTFTYTSGAGSLEIIDQDVNATSTVTAKLLGISSTQATFTLVQQAFGTVGLQITDGIAGDMITIDGMGNDTTQGVDRFVFSDATFTRAQAVALAKGTLTVSGVGSVGTPLQGGPGNNHITTTGTGAYIVSAGIYDIVTAQKGSANIRLLANSTGVGHDAWLILANGHNIVNAVDGNIKITGVTDNDQITLGNGNSSITGLGSGNIITAGSGSTTVTLGNISSNSLNVHSSNNTVSLLSGGAVTLFGNNNAVNLGSASVTDNTQYVGSTVSVTGSGNKITAFASYNQNLTDSAGSSGTTFTLTNQLGGAISALGSSDMAFISGGIVNLADQGAGTHIFVAQNADVSLTGFTSDSGAMLTLLPGEGYSSVSALLGGLRDDGHGGSFLALGTGGHGVDFINMSVSALTSFANSGTHFAIASSFSNGWQ